MNPLRSILAVLVFAAVAFLAFMPVALVACSGRTVIQDESPGPGVVRRREMREADPDPKAPTAREQAKADYAASVRTWGRVLTGLLVLVGVAALVLSFLPAANAIGLETREAVLVLLLSGATPVVQYALQAWGVLAADVTVWILLAGLIASAGTLAVMLAKRAKSFGIFSRRSPRR